MAKKIVLDSRSEPTYFTFLGISSQLPDYRVIFELNKQLGFSFAKEIDFITVNNKGELQPPCSFYLFHDEDHRLHFYLLANRHELGLLFPTIKLADFILILEGTIKKVQLDALLSSLRKVPKIQMVFDIKPSDLKNIDYFLTDLELHLLEINKEKRQKTLKK